uniref:UDP-glycosyltransferase 76G1-like n=1 Tax=Tanacetum cinerariifolium TaxID=118510 RepID=A0A699H753_TANCI|nr:UDP-glycosyltransferase 76G1-like [Tanacetum cinerariifolium]
MSRAAAKPIYMLKISVLLEDGLERVGIEKAIKRVMEDKKGKEIRDRISRMKKETAISFDEGSSAKWHPKVTIIEESKDLSTPPLDELIGNVKVYKVVLEKDLEISRNTKEKYKPLALKARKVLSEEEATSSDINDEEYAMTSDSEDDSKKEEICLMALDDNEDSGCSRHMMGNKDIPSSYKAIDEGYVVFDRNTKSKIVEKGIFLGYSPNSKDYVILNRETMRVEKSLNLKFDESPPHETPPLEDDDVLENENIKRQEKDLEIKENKPLKKEIPNIKESKDHPLETIIVYPLNTPATLVPRVLPTTSQVKIHIITLIQQFLEFDKTCKKRITPSSITDGEQSFEQTKACYLQEVIPFFQTIKDNFEGIQKALTREVKQMKDVFEELEAEVAQCAVDRKHDAIDRKNLLIANDNLIDECLSKEVFSVATKSKLNVARFTEMHVTNTSVEARCLALEAELATLCDNSVVLLVGE